MTLKDPTRNLTQLDALTAMEGDDASSARTECVPLGADVYESLCAVSLASNQLVIRHRDLQRGLQATQRESAVKDVEISHLR
ncbi:hypothetical protein RvY_11407 [Ramazzottius varieornatus]|uniref:Uncharacterized protein n=1 Tax=Ramazzottius varieornatus TaxID=947166 RepID=A0A1D1VG32_RAMVA|nr:hypothetical protein RvY_11407 [Ramazzottius varieornatus]